MKKVKIMLSAVAILGIVGGTLAFTAKKSQLCYYSTTGSLGASCPSVALIAAIQFTAEKQDVVVTTTFPEVTGCPSSSICNTYLSTLTVQD